MEVGGWEHPISYFVGRNGSGKSKAARALTRKLSTAHMLSTDRLIGLMRFTSYPWGAHPADYQGVPLDKNSRPQIQALSRETGAATDELFVLRERPELRLRVAAFIRRALHRTIELRESSGFLDPFVRLGNVEYSLLREEGHGLREIVVLLAATYRDDWKVLVVDEPELHLHPSLVRLWVAELEAECIRTRRQAIIITHEPSILKPANLDDLGAIWLFRPGGKPTTLRSCIAQGHEGRVTATLLQNPQLVSQLVFAPRPVLLEGVLDVIALNAALRRTQPAEVVAQTDLIDCGGSGGLAAWFAVARAAGLDVRAVGDLDCCLDPAVTRTIDSFDDVVRRYREEVFIEPPRTSTVVRPLLDAMQVEGVPADPKSRAKWMAANFSNDGNAARRDKLLDVWRDAGLWLHKTGTLESVLGLAEEDKTREAVLAAASSPSDIDAVAAWVAYELDLSGDVYELLSVTVERIAHSLLEALRLSPEDKFDHPVGNTAEGDARLVEVTYVDGTRRHRITVRRPEQFEGFWVEFDRNTPPSMLTLQAPTVPSP